MRIFVYILISFTIIACSTESEKHLESALQSAGANRNELEKVLAHYQNDSLKLSAAKFLIENMPGNFSINPHLVQACKPLYNAYDSISQKYKYQTTPQWGTEIDSLYKYYEQQIPFYELGSSLQEDAKFIKADWLIRQIDLAFNAWKHNCYTHNDSFEDFCEYILPYRRQNGLLLDNSREDYYKRFGHTFFTGKANNFIQETDSLLYLFRNLTHSKFYGMNIPIYDAHTLERLQHGLCEQRCWFNSIVLSSLGMKAAIDYIPSWGNRNNTHMWNSIIVQGNVYAFESYWDTDRWKYKRIYNNKTFDTEWGKFRIPKVFRYSFANSTEGPMTDKRVKKEDIPPLFNNLKYKDVSSQYFDTTNVTLQLSSVPHNTLYAYLCVFNYGNWTPVQWGRIENKRVTFKGMGRDIVYLPAFYKEGILQYAGNPFILDRTGKIQILSPNKTKQNIAVRNFSGAWLYNPNKNNISLLSKSIFLGKNANGLYADTLCKVPTYIDIHETRIPSNANKSYRYIRMQIPTDTLSASEISFYDKNTGILISGTRLVNSNSFRPLSPKEDISMLYDHLSSSGFKEKGLFHQVNFVDFDLGKEYHVASIGIIPYLDSEIYKGFRYILYYWKNKWIPLGEQNGTSPFLTFRNAPTSALYMLVRKNHEGQQRTFLYENDKVIWQ